MDCCAALEDVAIAFGHNMLGLSVAPATGKLIAKLLAGEKTFHRPRSLRSGLILGSH